MRVGAGGNHDDRNIADTSNRAANVKAIDAGKHDVDQDHIAGVAGKCLKRFLAGVCFLNLPTLVLKGEANGGTDSFVVLDGKDAGSHKSPLSPMGDRYVRFSNFGATDDGYALAASASTSSVRRSLNNAGGAARQNSNSGAPPVRLPTSAPASVAMSAPAA